MNCSRVLSMTHPALIDELKTLVEPGKVLTDADSLEAYGKDWTKHFAPAPTAIVFPKTIEQCLPHLEVVRAAVEGYLLQLRERGQRPRDDQQGRQKRGAKAAGSVSVTISIGVAQRQAAQLTTEAVLKAADQALYSAKGAGRNRVVAHGQVRRGAVRVAAVEA